MRRRWSRLALAATALLLAALPGAHFAGDDGEDPARVIEQVHGPGQHRGSDLVLGDSGSTASGAAQSVAGTAGIAGDSVIAPPPEQFDAPPEPSAPPPRPLQRSDFGGVSPEGGVWAVVIGINNYPGYGSDLRSAVNDARDVAHALAGFGVPGDRVLVIEDRQASAEVIRASLDWLVAHSARDATAVFFYAGHVRKLGSRTEAIVAADGELISDAEVAERLRPLAAQHAWIALATCYGGGFTELLGSGRVLTAAAGANSLAYENDSFRRSYLVQYMVRKAMIERQAPTSVQAAYEWAWHAIAREYPHRTPVQFDHAGSAVNLGTSASTATSPQPSQPPPPPDDGGGSGGGSEPPPPPEDEDDDGCAGVTVGSLIDCSPD